MTHHLEHAVATLNALLAHQTDKRMRDDIVTAAHGLIVAQNRLVILEELTRRQAAELDEMRRAAWTEVGE